MKLLDRYLLGQFFRHLLLILCSLVAIYLLVDFFERIDNFLEAHKPLSLAIQYFLFKIPQIIDQMMPVCILLAGVTTLGLLNHHHEFVALKAGGISVGRIVAPLIVGAVLANLASLGLGQWILPPTVAATNRIYYEEVQQRVATGIYRKGRIYYRGKEGIYTFRRPNLQRDIFVDFSYASWDEEYRLVRLLSAARASFQDGTWQFRHGQLKTRTAEGTYQISLFGNASFALPDVPDQFFIPEYKVQEQSLTDLYEAARLEAAEDTGREAQINFHRRLSYIFLGLPLLLLGIPVLLAVQQRRGRDLVVAIPVSCGLAFLAWGWWSTAQSLAKTASLPPAVISWSIHLVASAAGIFFIRRQDR